MNDDNTKAILDAAFERLRSSVLIATAAGKSQQRALVALDRLREEIDKDPSWIQRILDASRSSTHES